MRTPLRNFFSLVAGSLGAVAVGIGISWAAGRLWQGAFSGGAVLRVPEVVAAAAAAIQPSDGTSISGLSRIIRYTADEEEDLITDAALSLPAGADGKVSAKAYIAKDLATGQISAESDQDRLLPIASLSKLVTAVLARKLIPAGAEITITPAIMATYGNTADFLPGETFTAADLLYPLLLVSSNDAAEAYAQSYGRAAFIADMNAFVQSIGAYRTTFADPSGLSPDNESTADDMAAIVDWIRVHDPAILAVTELKSKTVGGHTWVNPTHFLSWSYYLGGKNGYTDQAESTGASLFALGPHKDPYVVVVLGSQNRDADVIKLLAKVK